MSSEAPAIHVRFSPDGSVTEIGERPTTLDAQSWFNLLTRTFPGSFQALSGGRGLFRLDADALAEARSIIIN